MRVPHTVPTNTLRAYAASDQTLILLHERNRILKAEDLSWDERVPLSLANLCVLSLVQNFTDHTEVLPLLPLQDLDYLLEVLPTELPISVAAPIIQDGIYWERCCNARWSKVPLDVSKHGRSWRRMLLEKHLQEFIEDQEPGFIHWDEVMFELEVCAPYVVRLEIKELKPPRELEAVPEPPDECARGKPNPDHIDLGPILSMLDHLEEFTLRFGVRNCGMKFDMAFFLISLNDIENLAKGLAQTQCLRIFKIHRCEIDDVKLNIILSRVIFLDTLEYLEVSHCKVGDIGAKSLGKFILEHKNLTALVLKNNNIGGDGAEGIAYALQQETCCPLRKLELEFNLIGNRGAELFAAALVKNKILQELNVSGAGIGVEGASKLADCLLFNNTLQKMDLSNNHLGPQCTPPLLAAMHSNRRIEVLDIRNCGLDNITETSVHKYLQRNRTANRVQ